jgi:hypothetical protein
MARMRLRRNPALTSAAMLVGMNTYFDPARFASLTDAPAEAARTLGLDVLIADLARSGITLEEYETARRVYGRLFGPRSAAAPAPVPCRPAQLD